MSPNPIIVAPEHGLSLRAVRFFFELKSRGITCGYFRYAKILDLLLFVISMEHQGLLERLKKQIIQKKSLI